MLPQPAPFSRLASKLCAQTYIVGTRDVCSLALLKLDSRRKAVNIALVMVEAFVSL